METIEYGKKQTGVEEDTEEERKPLQCGLSEMPPNCSSSAFCSSGQRSRVFVFVFFGEFFFFIE